MPLPLEGIRVLDWTAFQAGPVASCLLADMGAEVIKIEEPKGEPARTLQASYGIKLPTNIYFQNHNRGKLGMVLNLKLDKSKEILFELVKKSDVFITNFRENAAIRLGVGYETLRTHNPKLIYGISSSYGSRGPDANLGGSDFIGQARGGLWSVSRSANLDFAPIGAAMGDEMAGFCLAYGVMIALFVRERTGIGQRVDTSLLAGQMELGRYALQQYLFNAPPAPSTIAFLKSPLYNLYECKDGKWICFGVLQPDRYWHDFCKVLDIENLEKDPLYENADVRGDNIDKIMPILKGIFKKRNRPEWLKVLHDNNLEQVSAVQDYEDVSKDPQMIMNDYIVEVDDDIMGKVKVPGIPVELSETPGKIRKMAPELGQHTEEVLMNILGYTWEDLAKLRELGVY